MPYSFDPGESKGEHAIIIGSDSFFKLADELLGCLCEGDIRLAGLSFELIDVVKPDDSEHFG